MTHFETMQTAGGPICKGWTLNSSSKNTAAHPGSSWAPWRRAPPGPAPWTSCCGPPSRCSTAPRTGRAPGRRWRTRWPRSAAGPGAAGMPPARWRSGTRASWGWTTCRRSPPPCPWRSWHSATPPESLGENVHNEKVQKTWMIAADKRWKARHHTTVCESVISRYKPFWNSASVSTHLGGHAHWQWQKRLIFKKACNG